MKKRVIYDPLDGVTVADSQAWDEARIFVARLMKVPDLEHVGWANERVIREIRMALFEGVRDRVIDLDEWELEDRSFPDDVRVFEFGRFGGLEPADELPRGSLLNRGINISTAIIRIAAAKRREERAAKEAETS